MEIQLFSAKDQESGGQKEVEIGTTSQWPGSGLGAAQGRSPYSCFTDEQVTEVQGSHLSEVPRAALGRSGALQPDFMPISFPLPAGLLEACAIISLGMCISHL